MKDSEFSKLLEFSFDGVGLLPANQNASDLLNQLKRGDTVPFKEISSRDISFHRNYMALLRFIWSKLPVAFQHKVKVEKFYTWLKHLKKDYDIVFEYSDGTKYVEYKSISFSKMSEVEFHEYIKDQISYIYEDVIIPLYLDDMDKANKIIGEIEDQFQRFFDKL